MLTATDVLVEAALVLVLVLVIAVVGVVVVEVAIVVGVVVWGTAVTKVIVSTVDTDKAQRSIRFSSLPSPFPFPPWCPSPPPRCRHGVYLFSHGFFG